ncbi:hypothetical protein H5410_026281 [Solanum commersonii]|uniref:ATP-dependent DNA helicase n=1 Tax=Solanum commersonii TaxID=4109 RepID=A0A9J5YY75_SOLCO|nr:hypothetical protein H5410_026281 [Solanum commersonii]
MGQSMDKYDIPQIKQQVHQTDPDECKEIIEELSVKVPVEDVDVESKWAWGTGKTFLYRALLAKVRLKGMIALASATSGVATILPGGRKVMVLGGDFRQVLPVVPKSTRAKTIDEILVKSYIWPLMEKIKLSTNMRARADTTFSDFLLRIGNGEETTIHDNLIALSKQMTVQLSQDSNPEESLVTKIFSSLQQNYRSADYITERAILASRNEFVNNPNEMMIGKFPRETKTYISFESTEDVTNNYY